MQRLNIVKSYVHRIISDISSPSEKMAANIHLYGVSSFCAMLALKRGIDSELAAISGLLHDIYSYKSGVLMYHAHSGAEMARPVLRDFGVFSPQEQQVILSAIFHHSDKEHTHDEYDEVLKDADVLQSFLCDAGLRIPSYRKPRLDKMREELDLHVDPEIYENTIPPSSMDNHDVKNRLAEIAERLAARGIVGEPEDNEYMEITHYWPDDNIAGVLKNGWCSAFVYYCCMQAGFHLPIRVPNSSCRLAGVKAWYEWSKSANIFIQDCSNFLPERGDIVIFRNIVPPEKKSDKTTPTDHIGIVLSSDANGFMAAEGNINNDNVSGIIRRPHHKNIEGFIRISGSYEYDGWKFDYKTGKNRIELF